MSKNLRITFLLDFYGEMLTDKQKDVIELYYNEDLSLAEIAETSGITRQGVRDSIKRGEQVLLDLEDKLGLAGKFEKYIQSLEQIEVLAKSIQDENSKYSYSRSLNNKAQGIIKCVEAVKEII